MPTHLGTNRDVEAVYLDSDKTVSAIYDGRQTFPVFPTTERGSLRSVGFTNFSEATNGLLTLSAAGASWGYPRLINNQPDAPAAWFVAVQNAVAYRLSELEVRKNPAAGLPDIVLRFHAYLANGSVVEATGTQLAATVPRTGWQVWAGDRVVTFDVVETHSSALGYRYTAALSGASQAFRDLGALVDLLYARRPVSDGGTGQRTESVAWVPGPATGASGIAAFTAHSANNPNQKTNELAVDSVYLPTTVTLEAHVVNTTSWEIVRVLSDGTSSQVAAGTGTQPSYTENLTTDLHPGADGWTYNLVTYNSRLAGSAGTRYATLEVLVVTPPTLTAFSATAPSSVSGPFTFQQCSWLTWSATAGDPPATWTLSQSGFRLVQLPSSRRLTPAFGTATGNSRQRVCTTQRPGEATVLTLTGTNEGGSASRSVTINWAGGA